MGSSSRYLYKIANSNKIKVLAKVWKVQVKIPGDLCLKKNIANDKSTEWVIYQLLN